MSIFENFGERRVEPGARMECGICWFVYDPQNGDPVWQVAPGTPFSELPEGWTCPNCDAPPSKFMRLDDGR